MKRGGRQSERVEADDEAILDRIERQQAAREAREILHTLELCEVLESVLRDRLMVPITADDLIE
jgi:hypothetical protein